MWLILLLLFGASLAHLFSIRFSISGGEVVLLPGAGLGIYISQVFRCGCWR